MVSAQPWKPSAIVRFILCILSFAFCGSLLISLTHHPLAGSNQDLQFYRLTYSALGLSAASVAFVYRPWPAEKMLWRLGYYVTCLYTGLGLGAAAAKTAGVFGPSISQMIISGLSLQGMALLLAAHFLHEQNLGWRDAFGFANQWRDAVTLGIIVACLFLPVALGLQWLSAEVMIHLPGLQLKPQQQESVQTLQMAATWFHRVVLAGVTILLAPVAEEVLFRGVLYPAIKRAGFPRIALWGTALFFALMHTNMVTFLPLVALALALTWLYERTDNLWAPITAHALFNAVNYVMLYWQLERFTGTK